jgi:hypothetical protein
MKDKSIEKLARKLGATKPEAKKKSKLTPEQVMDKHLENMRDGKTPKGIGGMKTYYV